MNPGCNGMPPPLDKWLETLVENEGSDILLVSDAPVCMLVDGEVHGMDTKPLTGPEIESAVVPALTPHALELYRRDGIADSSYRVPGLGRFRINLHHQKGEAAAAIRALPTRIPKLSELNLPPQVQALAQLKRGLVLIGGAAGSGKTTTVAALIHEINRTSARHIVIIEDPLEYEHTHEHSIIEQVEIGTDAPDFPTALRAALRQAPEIIVVGEMRDPETMRIAVSAAETGHLVFSTLHTTDIASTVARVADSFPVERQNTIRQDLSMALTAVMTQTLVPSSSGRRAPAVELLMVGYGTRHHIRRNALQHLHQEITLTKNLGSQTLEESLARLVSERKILREEAMMRAVHQDDLVSLLKTAHNMSA